MGQECQKLSESFILNPVLQNLQKSSHSTAPSSNSDEANAHVDGSDGMGARTGVEFLNPFGSTFTTRNNQVAWKWIAEESTVKDYTRHNILWVFVRDLLKKLSHSDVHLLLRTFRRMVDAERNHKGLLLYRPQAQGSEIPSAVNDGRSVDASEAIDDDDALSITDSVSAVGSVDESHAMSSKVSPIGHIWKKMSLTERSLTQQFASVSYSQLSAVWIDACNHFLFADVTEESETDWQTTQFQKDHMRTFGLRLLRQNLLLRLFFVIDLLHSGTHVIDPLVEKSGWRSVFGSIGHKKHRNRPQKARRQIVFRDVCTAVAAVLHGNRFDLLSLLLIVFSAEHIDIPHFQSSADMLPPFNRLFLSNHCVEAMAVYMLTMLLHPIHGQCHRFQVIDKTTRRATNETNAFVVLAEKLRELLRRLDLQKESDGIESQPARSVDELLVMINGDDQAPADASIPREMSSIDAMVRILKDCDAEMLRFLFRSVINDAVPNPFSMACKIVDDLSCLPSVVRLKDEIGLLHRYNQALFSTSIIAELTNNNKLKNGQRKKKIDDILKKVHCDSFTSEEQTRLYRQLTCSEHELFLLEATWFSKWCSAMDLVPMPLMPPTDSVVQQLQSILPESQNRAMPSWLQNESLRCLVLGFSGGSTGGDKPFRFEQALSNPLATRLACDDSGFAVDLYDLDNSWLLQSEQRFAGAFELKNSEELLPWNLNEFIDSNCETTKYVAVPYELGLQLYFHYDRNSTAIPPTVYRRKLCFLSNVAALLSAEQAGDSSCETDNALDLFVHNFSNQTHGISCELMIGNDCVSNASNAKKTYSSHYNGIRSRRWRAPCYWTTASGLATCYPTGEVCFFVRASLKVSHAEGDTVGDSRRWNILDMAADIDHGQSIVKSVQSMTAQEFLMHLLPDNCASVAPPDAFRLWGLFPVQQAEPVVSFHHVHVLPFTQDYIWILLPNSFKVADMLTPSLGEIFDTPKTEATVLQTATKSSAVLGFMIESRDIQGAWPCDRLCDSGLHRTIMLDEFKPVLDDVNTASPSQCLRVGLLADVLLDDGSYQLMEVSGVEKSHSESCQHELITLTFRDPLLSSVGSSLCQTICLSFPSRRVFSAGAVTCILAKTNEARGGWSQRLYIEDHGDEFDERIVNCIHWSMRTFMLLQGMRSFRIKDSVSSTTVFESHDNFSDSVDSNLGCAACVYVGNAGESGLVALLHHRGLVLEFIADPESTGGEEPHQPNSSSSSAAVVTNNIQLVPTSSVSTAHPLKSRENLRLGIVGLANLGNTCFLSAALQCLLRTPLLVSYLVSMQFKKHINVKSKLGSGGKVVEELGRLFTCVYYCKETGLQPSTFEESSKSQGSVLGTRANASSGSPKNGEKSGILGVKASSPQVVQKSTKFSFFSSSSAPVASSASTSVRKRAINQLSQFPLLSPTALMAVLQSHKSQFCGGDQQDSQELLVELLDSVHEDLKENIVWLNSDRSGPVRDDQPGSIATLSNPPSVESLNPLAEAPDNARAYAKNPTVEGRKAWESYLSRDSSIVSHCFQGQLCNEVICSRCNSSSLSFEPFTTLPLPMPGSSINSNQSGGTGNRNNAKDYVAVESQKVYPVVVHLHRRLPRVSLLFQLKPFLERILSALRTETVVEAPHSNDGKFADISLVLQQLWDDLEESMVRNAEIFLVTLPLLPSASVEDVKRLAATKQLLHQKKRSSDLFRLQVTNRQECDEQPDPQRKSDMALESVENLDLDMEPPDRQLHNEQDADPGSMDMTETTLDRDDMMEIDEFVSNSSLCYMGTTDVFKLKKILDNKESLFEVLEDSLGGAAVASDSKELAYRSAKGLALLLVENNKNLPLISSTAASTFSSQQRMSDSQLSIISTRICEFFALSNEELRSKLSYSKDAPGSVFNIALLEEFLRVLLLHRSDEIEYAAHSAPSESLLATFGLLPSQGCLISDLDNIQVETPTVPEEIETREETSAALVTPVKLRRAKTVKNKRSFPKSIQEFALFDRVDAQDHKGQWFAASVVEIVVADKPIVKAKELQKAREREKEQKREAEREAAREKKAAAMPSLMKRKSFSASSNAVGVDSAQPTNTAYDRQRETKSKAVELASSSQKNTSSFRSTSVAVDREGSLRSRKEPSELESSKASVTLIRVHFDGYSAVWDEWFADCDMQRLAPVYSKTARKLKIFDLQVVQRRLSYYWKDASVSVKCADGNEPPASTDSRKVSLEHCSVGKIELLDSPWLVQCESFRSVEYAFKHIVEQALRFLSSDERTNLMHEDVSSPQRTEFINRVIEKLPFRIRLLSSQNLHCLPLTAAMVEESVEQQIRAGAVAMNSATALNATLLKTLSVSSYDASYQTQLRKVYGLQYKHKYWEGSAFPRNELNRPVANLFHSKLIIAVDWEVLALPSLELGRIVLRSLEPLSDPAAGSLAASESRSLAPFESNDALTFDRDVNSGDLDGEYVLPLVWLTPSLVAECSLRMKSTSPVATVVEDESYKLYWSRLRDKMREMRSESMAGAASSDAQSTLDYLSPKPIAPDTRPGLPIENVLREFTASELLSDYHCSSCGGPQQGTLYTSIHTLPDILVLHLKRLVMNSTGGMKIRTLVKFPIDGLQLKPFTTEYFHNDRERERNVKLTGGPGDSDSVTELSANAVPFDEMSRVDDPNCTYDLFGVVNHLGGMSGGHYTAFVNCEDITAGSDPCINLRSDYDGATWQDSHVLLRELLTEVGVCKDSIGDHVAGSTSASASARSPSMRWYKFDDEFVHDMNYSSPSSLSASVIGAPNALRTNATSAVEQAIVSESAYLLFYRKRQLSKENLMRYL